MPQFRGGHIKALLQRRHIKITHLAEKVGVSREFLSALVNSRKRPSAEVALRLARELEVSVDWIFTGGNTSYGERLVGIPLRGEIPTTILNLEGEVEQTVPVVLSQLPAGTDVSRLFALKVVDNQLADDRVFIGDMLVCHPMPIDIPDGAICIVKVHDQIVVKHVYIEPPHVRLVSGSKMATYPADDVKILAKVIGSQRFQEL